MTNNNIMMNLLMNKLLQTNPQGYSQIQQWMNSGKNPQEILNQMLANNQITPQQLEQAKQMASQYKIQNTNQRNRF